MAEKVRLKIPQDPDIPEEVAMGNFNYRLEPGSEIEVDGKAAGWLIAEYGLKPQRKKEVKNG